MRACKNVVSTHPIRFCQLYLINHHYSFRLIGASRTASQPITHCVDFINKSVCTAFCNVTELTEHRAYDPANCDEHKKYIFIYRWRIERPVKWIFIFDFNLTNARGSGTCSCHTRWHGRSISETPRKFRIEWIWIMANGDFLLAEILHVRCTRRTHYEFSIFATISAPLSLSICSCQRDAIAEKSIRICATAVCLYAVAVKLRRYECRMLNTTPTE